MCVVILDEAECCRCVCFAVDIGGGKGMIEWKMCVVSLDEAECCRCVCVFCC